MTLMNDPANWFKNFFIHTGLSYSNVNEFGLKIFQQRTGDDIQKTLLKN
jgi:hypothetical protein